jgi:hypothetical protein
MKKQRRLYYVPGMISLIVLPIICYCYLIPFKKEERVIEVVFAEKYRPENKNSLIRFDTSFLSHPKYRRHYLDIKLTGNPTDDKIKLDFFQLRIHDMIKEKDTVNGVHLIFVDSVKYGSFVKSLNICLIEGLLRYALFENNLWALHVNDSKEFIERMEKRKRENEEKNREALLNRKITNWHFSDWLNVTKKIWPIFIMILILILISINKMKKYR